MANPEGCGRYVPSRNEQRLELIRNGLSHVSKQFPEFNLTCYYSNVADETLYVIKSLMDMVKRLKYACETYEEANKKLEDASFKLLENITVCNGILFKKTKGENEEDEKTDA